MPRCLDAFFIFFVQQTFHDSPVSKTSRPSSSCCIPKAPNPAVLIPAHSALARRVPSSSAMDGKKAISVDKLGTSDPEDLRRQQAHLNFTASRQARHAARQQPRRCVKNVFHRSSGQFMFEETRKQPIHLLQGLGSVLKLASYHPTNHSATNLRRLDTGFRFCTISCERLLSVHLRASPRLFKNLVAVSVYGIIYKRPKRKQSLLQGTGDSRAGVPTRHCRTNFTPAVC